MKVKKIKQTKEESLPRKTETETPPTFDCRAIFGLGITSVVDFVYLCEKYKSLREAGVHWYTADAINLSKKAQIHVFSSLKDVFRFSSKIQPNHIIVISEVPAILKEVPNLYPLDYDMHRSFEFNFKPVDIQAVRSSLKQKSVITSTLTTQDVLGYHIDRIKNTSELIASFISLSTNLPFDQRTLLRKSMFRFFQTKKVDTKIVTSTVQDISKTFKVKDQAKEFNKNFSNEGELYHQAVNNSQIKSLSTLANKYNIDLYTLSYMKKLIRTMGIVNNRNAKSNVDILG